VARGSEEGYVTIVGKLIVSDDVLASKLLLFMRRFRDSVEMAHNMTARRRLSESEVKRRLTRYLSNAWYASSAIKMSKLYREQDHLRLRKPLLYSLGSRDENGNRNIKFISTDRVLIKIPREDGRHEWIECKTLFSKKHLPVIEELVKGEYSYSAGVAIKLGKGGDWRSVWRKKLVIFVNVPVELYIKHRNPGVDVAGAVSGNWLLAGFDFNVDRVSMAIVDPAGRLRDARTEFFSDAVNTPREASDNARKEAVAKLVKYAVAHGVRYIAVESLRRPGKIEGRVGRWAHRQYLQHLEVLARRFGLEVIEVNPAYSTIDAIGIALTLGLDKHTASAYIIALRGLAHKSM
jgi:hypothetical protein